MKITHHFIQSILPNIPIETQKAKSFYICYNSMFVTILAQSSYKVWKICYHILGLQCIRYISTFSAKIISHKNLYYCANIKRIYRRELVVLVKTILINMTLASIQYGPGSTHLQMDFVCYAF